MKKIITLSLIVLALGFFSLSQNTTAQLADSPWPTFKGNSKHTGLSPYRSNLESPILKWKFDAGDGIETSPAIGPDGTIYFGTFRNNFFALNPDGTEKWRFTRPNESFGSSPTIARDGTIYFGAVTNLRLVYNVLYKKEMEYGVPAVYALNPDGSLKWQFITGGILGGTYSSPTVGPDGTIYMGAGGKLTKDAKGENRLWAINPDGTAKWYFETGEAIYSAAAIADDGTIYIGCGDGNVYAITPEGKEKWRFTRKEGDFSVFDSTPVIGSDGTVYAGSTNKNLYAITPQGQEKWHFTTLDMVEASPSIGPDGTIYAGTIDKGSKDRNLYALNPDGSLKWKFEAGDGVYATPAISAEGRLYFGSYDGNLYALTPDGTEKWRYKVAGGISLPPAINKDGTIYFGSWDHNLYAIGSEKSEIAKIGSSNKPRTISAIILVSLYLIAIAGSIYGVWQLRKKVAGKEENSITKMIPANHGRFMPKTKLGKWSVGLIIVFVLLLALSQILVASGQRGEETFWDNLWLTIPILLAGACAVTSLISGVASITKNKERSALVFISSLIGLLVLLFVLGEFLFPY